jgi:hypothetical protein
LLEERRGGAAGLDDVGAGCGGPLQQAGVQLVGSATSVLSPLIGFDTMICR